MESDILVKEYVEPVWTHITEQLEKKEQIGDAEDSESEAAVAETAQANPPAAEMSEESELHSEEEEEDRHTG